MFPPEIPEGNICVLHNHLTRRKRKCMHASQQGRAFVQVVVLNDGAFPKMQTLCGISSYNILTAADMKLATQNSTCNAY